MCIRDRLANDAKQWVEAIQEYANITELDAATLNRLIKEIVVHERIDEDKTRDVYKRQLLGWDMGRCAYITQCCYLAGYINMKEMLDLCVDSGTKAQAFFQNWEEMMESYLLGGQFWKHEDQSNPNSMTAERWKLYWIDQAFRR